MILHDNNNFISLSVLRQLSILKPWKSISVILLEWLVIIVCIFIHKLFPSTVVYLFVWFVIATRLYAMYSLLHEAIHYSITRNKIWNDIIAQVFLGFPLLISLKSMRENHMTHHKYLQTDQDPEMKHLSYKEFHFPATKIELLQLFLLDITGINFMYYKLQKLYNLIFHFSSKKLVSLLEIFLFVNIFVLAYYFGFAIDLLIYWLIPYATIYQLLNRIRLSTEHFNIDETNSFKTRSVIPSFIEKLIFTPYNLGYHLEHHLYPTIPFYNLPKLHNLLIENEAYQKEAIVHSSYSQVLRDFIK